MKLKWTPSEGEFYAGDVFNRDSSVCAYNCADVEVFLQRLLLIQQ